MCPCSLSLRRAVSSWLCGEAGCGVDVELKGLGPDLVIGVPSPVVSCAAAWVDGGTGLFVTGLSLSGIYADA